ncbi:DUF6705 family protein [Chryseobacterium sp. SL1]|uniref:DUF6705 family protein n=1 Tax=Chryseobacterium sp. SL1 TaxID=2995159 RepID=UPI002275197F|nr:DUF6705 family protein [Chryseobacterium sp. SL1]MCY1661419.1 hypothetical protein [Chryseobacterium sp. SL1]
MKNIFLLSVMLFCFSCKAQQEYPLNTIPSDIPDNSYIKDYNNELNPFIGIFKSTYNGNEVTLYISKNIKRQFTRNGTTISHYFKDALLIKFIIKDSSGNTIQNTVDNNNDNRHFIANTFIMPSQNIAKFYYTGADCGIGWGSIDIKKINNSQISWSYYPNSTAINSVNCLNPIETAIYLPETENLIFTKQ